MLNKNNFVSLISGVFFIILAICIPNTIVEAETIKTGELHWEGYIVNAYFSTTGKYWKLVDQTKVNNLPVKMFMHTESNQVVIRSYSKKGIRSKDAFYQKPSQLSIVPMLWLNGINEEKPIIIIYYDDNGDHDDHWIDLDRYKFVAIFPPKYL
jgi:hypothetical protein